MTARSQLLGVGSILVLITLVYWSGLSGGYLFDDFPNLVANDGTTLAQLTPRKLLTAALAGDSGPLARPISMLSFALERHFFGLDPWPMKLTNLIIHLANTLLVFSLIRALLERAQLRYPERVKPLISLPTLALLVAAVWGLAPINLTAVLLVVQRMESLATLFMLLGLLAYVRGRRHMEEGRERRGLLWVTGGFLLGEGLGALAKESAVMFPLYALLIEWMFFGFGEKGTLTRRHLVRVYGVFLIAPAILGLGLYLPGILSGGSFQNRPYDLQARLWTETRVVWHYLWWTLAPEPGQLSLYHDDFPLSQGPLHPWTGIPSALGLAALIGGAFLVRRRHPLASFGILWFFVMQLLVSTIFPLELVFEHRNYMGSMGIFLALLSLLLVGQGGERLHWARRALVAGLIASYGILTLVRAQEWGDPLRLAFAEAERHPRSVRANYELGKALYAIAPDPGSLPFSKATEAMERAWQLPRTSLLPVQALLLMHAKYGLPLEDAWWTGMRKYIDSRPLAAQDINALYSLIAARIAGVTELPDAELGLVFKEAYDQNPGRYLLATLYANYLLNVRGDPERAETMLQRAVALAPKNPQMWINLINLQLATGRTHAAKISISRLAELDRLGTLGPEIDRLRRLADKQKARAPTSPSPPRS